MKKKYDFGGWATRADLVCTDDRIINRGAFHDQNGTKIPLVWEHRRDNPDNILGHAYLEERGEGVYAYCSLNGTPAADTARELIRHGDASSLSIYATGLVQKNGRIKVGEESKEVKYVMHGNIKEVSLVLNGANPGAYIDDVSFVHADDEFSDEAVIYTGLTLEHSAEPVESSPSPDSGKTVKDVIDGMSEEQRNVMYYLIGEALSGEGEEELEQSGDRGGTYFMNVFDKNEDGADEFELTHAQIETLFADAAKFGSFQDSVMVHAADYGIDDIEFLFPEAKNLDNEPEFISRRMEWVSQVLGGTRKLPFSRVKTIQADITADEARAKGYVKGNRKTEEVIKLLRRSTTPTTIYKKQKLDRDDIVDIKDLNVVSWLWTEMRVMLDEEIARAILVGDGRPATIAGGDPNPDKIDEEHIRPILTDDELFVDQILIETPFDAKTFPDEVTRAARALKGTGRPTLYTVRDHVTDMLLVRDDYDQRMYKTEGELASACAVSSVVDVEVMEGVTVEVDTDMYEVAGIVVNLSDYGIGTDNGGEITKFEQFDIDYNQQKMLIEGRMSGALTRVKSAAVILIKIA